MCVEAQSPDPERRLLVLGLGYLLKQRIADMAEDRSTRAIHVQPRQRAANRPFRIDAAEHKAHKEGKCGEGKCGEGKCGGSV